MAPPQSRFHQFQSLWPYALLALAILVAYSNVYNNTFFFDDEFLLVKNAFLRSWDHMADIFRTSTTAGFGGKDSFYRPLQIFCYFILTQLFGLSTVAYHALNVLLHIGNAALMLMLAEKLGFKRGPALFVTLLWAVHPIHTEAVTYMSATADPLHVLLMLGGLLAWDNNDLRRQAVTAGLFVLALLAKETAIVFPALLVLTVYFRDRSDVWRKLLKTWPLWVIAALYLAARVTILNFNNDFDFYKTVNIYTQDVFVRILSFLATLPDYFLLLLAPHDLHMERKISLFTEIFHPQVLFGAAMVLGSIYLAVKSLLSRKNRALAALAFGVVWFFVAYFPCSGILIPVNALFLEHWMYLPSIGLFLGVTEAGAILLEKKEGVKNTAVFLACVAAFAMALLTWMQNGTWSDPIAFYTHILRYEEGSARLHNNLAMAYEEKNEDALAFWHYQQAVTLEDRYPQTHYNMARLMLKLGKMDEATDELNRALKIDPQFPQAKELLEQLDRKPSYN